MPFECLLYAWFYLDIFRKKLQNIDITITFKALILMVD